MDRVLVEYGLESMGLAYHKTRNTDQSCNDNTKENKSLASVHSWLLVLDLGLSHSEFLGVLLGEESLDELLNLKIISERDIRDVEEKGIPLHIEH